MANPASGCALVVTRLQDRGQNGDEVGDVLVVLAEKVRPACVDSLGTDGDGTDVEHDEVVQQVRADGRGQVGRSRASRWSRQEFTPTK